MQSLPISFTYILIPTSDKTHMYYSLLRKNVVYTKYIFKFTIKSHICSITYNMLILYNK